MEINSLVILSLAGPKEKVWGQLLMLTSAGVTVRGINLESFEDLLRQVVEDEVSVGMTTLFFPMHRVERIALDEPSGSLPSLADRFLAKCGMSVREYMERSSEGSG